MSIVDLVANSTLTSYSSFRPLKTNFNSGQASTGTTIRDYTIAGIYPSPRGGQRMVVYNGNLYMFGGYNGTSFLGDLWQYNLTTFQWTQLSPSGSGPSARYEHFMVVYGSLIYVGFGWGNQFFNDLYSYDPVGNAWATIATTNTPSARQSEAVVSVSGLSRIYIFGGLGGTQQRMDDMWYLDMGTLAWTQSPNTLVEPTTNMWCIANTDGYIYLYGGDGNTTPVIDYITQFSETALTISAFNGSGTSPGGLHYHRMGVYNGIIYVYGGLNPSGIPSNTLYVLNISTQTWGVSIPNILSYPRASAGFFMNGNVIYSDDGYLNTVGSTSYSEDWSYDVVANKATQLPGKQQYVNSTSLSLNNCTFQSFLSGGNACLKITVNQSASSGAILSLNGLRLNC